jgi:hypothetical protein
MLSFRSCPTCPAAGVQRARSAVPRLTLAADAGGQPGLIPSVAAGIAPVLMDQMGAGAPSRPVRRRPELTARGTAPVRAAASSSSVQGLLCAVAHAGAARGAAPGAPIGVWRRAGPVRLAGWMSRPAGG